MWGKARWQKQDERVERGDGNEKKAKEKVDGSRTIWQGHVQRTCDETAEKSVQMKVRKWTREIQERDLSLFLESGMSTKTCIGINWSVTVTNASRIFYPSIRVMHGPDVAAPHSKTGPYKELWRPTLGYLPSTSRPNFLYTGAVRWQCPHQSE